jgi:lipoate-protein ligase A
MAVTPRGTTDLALGDRKFSGNAQRRKRHWLLFHGTILYRFDLAFIERLLPLPARQPDYRHDRGHGDFLANLPLPAEAIRQALRGAWDVTKPCRSWPREQVATLVAERYGREEWHRKFV